MRLAAVLCWFGLAACTREVHRETVEHGRFEPLELVVPGSPRSVALLLAGPAERELADALTAQVVDEGGIVTRVAVEPFVRLLDATPSGCVFPSGDLDNLAHFVQAYLKLPSYQPPILIGLGVGAGLAAAALGQAPASTFAGAITFDLCGTPSLAVPLCPREGTAGSISASGTPATGTSASGASASGTPATGTPASGASASSALPPAPVLTDPLLRLETPGHAACSSSAPGASTLPGRAASGFGSAFTTLAAAARARATSAPSDMEDMPISEVLAQGPGHADTFGILLSGDGGWAGLDKEVSNRLARRGLPIVGIDSLRYFWSARSPEGTATDVARVIERYQVAWQRPRVVLIGYSQGADVLPFVLNRLPEKARGAVVRAVALSLSTTATFEFHVRNWMGASGDRPTLPETQRLAHGSLVCVFGKADGDSLCPQLDPSAFRVVELPGDHHFNGDYDRLSSIVLEAIQPI